MLSIQYRMCTEIMAWSSQEMYGGGLTAHESVSKQRLMDLISDENTVDDESLISPLVFVDTAGCGLNEADLSEPGDLVSSESRSNLGELEIVWQHINRLLRAGLQPFQIAVVTPYRAQVEVILNHLQSFTLTEGIEVRTVDGFQGQEREAIILSMVRSNPERKVGFLADERRLNVAITRAKRHVCMIGDSVTLDSNPFLKRLVAYFSEHGEIHSAAEFIETLNPIENSISSAKTNKKHGSEKKKLPTESKKEPKPAVLQSKRTMIVPAHVKPSTKPSFKPTFNDDQERKTNFVALDSGEESDSQEDNHDNLEQDNEPDGEDRLEDQLTGSSSTKKKPNKKKKKKGSIKSSVNDGGKEEEQDDDEEWAFLEQAAKAANRCIFAGCGVYVELVGHTCVFCKQRFCLNHCQAEKHGCGDIARRKAFEGNGKQPPLKVRDRDKLKIKLQEKIQSEEKNRVSKVTQKTKKS